MKNFEFLSRPAASDAAALCGRNVVQVRPHQDAEMNLDGVAEKLGSAGTVENLGFMVRCKLQTPKGIRLSIFPDGRVLVDGTADLALARSLVSRYVGM
jgi:adenylyltransferase/sulfurtransferase